MEPDALFDRYRELQAYVGWTDEDARHVQSLAAGLDDHLPPLVEDFYAEIDRHPEARRVITGGPAQVERLKGTLLNWLRELLRGPYDSAYVQRRWRVGWRHVEIGLNQVFTNVALSRLRRGLLRALDALTPAVDVEARRSLNTLLDLDLAIIEEAYQAEHRARLQLSERLATIGQVAGGVAHELRNPLNVVKTSAYYLLNARNPSPEKTAEHLKRIEQHVNVADSVITALSSFARMPRPTLSPISVTDCVREALANNVFPENIGVALDFPSSLPPALGDAEQLRIVFANLIRNARDAMPTGGRLTIRSRAVDGIVEIVFEDTGVGIPAENLSRVMEPLYSTKARGLGLGLAIAKAILDKHAGTLSAASAAGRGSTFTVRLTIPGSDEGRQPQTTKQGVP